VITGARTGVLSGLRRLVAVATSRDLRAFLIPGIDVARAHGLDIEAAGLRLVASPRHASVLVLVGPLHGELRNAGAVIYAQMLRPRALLVLGTTKLSPLPAADVSAELSQQGLIDGVLQLRQVFATESFVPTTKDFDAPLLHVRIEYSCTMHPEIAQDMPGSCPKCGMTLFPREVQAGIENDHDHDSRLEPATTISTTTLPEHEGKPNMENSTMTEYTCLMHPEVVQNEPGSCPKCGMFLEPREPDGDSGAQSEALEYTCPMHPEVVQNEPGSCPKCGMFLEPKT